MGAGLRRRYRRTWIFPSISRALARDVGVGKGQGPAGQSLTFSFLLHPALACRTTLEPPLPWRPEEPEGTHWVWGSAVSRELHRQGVLTTRPP